MVLPVELFLAFTPIAAVCEQCGGAVDDGEPVCADCAEAAEDPWSGE